MYTTGTVIVISLVSIIIGCFLGGSIALVAIAGELDENK